jgi:methylenetetrahydrofolate dehydrogenase (NADP+)/methenyltetrahydrofolate cyclohydrolase
MSAKILEGGPIADQISADLEQQIADLGGAPPRLVALMVGDNAGARAYAKMQAKACGEVGIEYELRELGEETSQEELRAAIEAANADDPVNGIILQMPVPEQIDGQEMQAAIAPAKDVDGVHPTNLGYLAEGNPRLTPCTAEAAVRLVEESGVEVSGAEVVVVGRSVIVGKPTALMLLDRGATVTICRSTTRDLPFHTSRADILVAAVGRAELIKGDEVKPGALVVDVGMNRVKDPDTGKSKYVGDVAFDEAKEVAGIITPVPGGVGPLTVTMLLKNTVEATRLQRA